jgi:endonuclease G, mitochondrial
MNRKERITRLRTMLRQVTEGADVETLLREPVLPSAGRLESMSWSEDEGREHVNRAVEKIVLDKELADPEIFALEAIVMPRERPVVFIQNGTYGHLPDPWSHFAENAISGRLMAAIPSIGRVELPDNPRLPYGGTGFVVGQRLLMTNRHVAELFTNGLGLRGLTFRSGQSAALNFRREKGDAEDDQRAFVRVEQVVMIHPYWDMALLRIDELPRGVVPLKLAVCPPEELIGREVAVIGYPARDDRSDLALQDRIFEQTYNVKRLQPGKIRVREKIFSFGNLVNATTHDSSTLGGNSGSAIIDVTTGEVVGLHFAGVYLKANYAVPTYELARDSRVVDAGVNFMGTVPSTTDWAAAWRLADQDEDSAVSPTQASPATIQQSVKISSPSGPRVDGLTTTWMIPLRVSVTLGDGVLGLIAGAAQIEAMRIPIIHGNIESRRGYQSNFLDLSDDEIPLPTLTEAGRKVAATFDDGAIELKYHKFSVVMHKKRRLALFTASNIDWRESSRMIDGRKPSRKELTGLGPNDQEQWVTDERIPDAHQLPDVFFTKDGGAFDKGHLVRRDDVCWGSTFDDIQMANGDTYHTTNCSPQVASFNQSAKGEDNWGDLENLVQKQTKAEKAIVFAGPVLAEDDPIFIGRDKRGEVHIQIPRKFWKIIVVKGDDGPEAFGFTLEQDLSAVPTEFIVPSQWKRYMCKIVDIEHLLNNLAKLSDLRRIDQFGTVKGCSVKETL